MAEINVRFPKSGSPLVMPDPEAVVTGRPFLFSIKNENSKIKVVGIKFKGARMFFPDQSGEAQRVCEKPLVNGQAAIWAVVPKGDTEPAKYTVYGKTELDGAVVESLDPKILPTDP